MLEIKHKFTDVNELVTTYPIGYIISSISIKRACNETYYNNNDFKR